ncbi:MAG: glycine betaine ABC transporter substrate-binding protein [Dehalococcoidia bacterium]
MFGKASLPRLLGLIIAVLGMILVGAACAGEEKEPIKFHDGQWESNWEHINIAGYIIKHGYDYPVEFVEGTTGTMLVTLPEGDIDVNMELWRKNIQPWYDENIANGKIVDLTGTGDSVPNGSKGQILETSRQGWYVPTYVVEENPGLKSVLDLPDYKHLFPDPEDPSKGVWVNCIIGWQCQKIFRAKSFAYGLDEHYNVIEPGSGGAIEANIYGAYQAGEPVLSYYWEPTKLMNDLDMTLLEEPEWNEACHAAIQAAIEAEPYESEVACAEQEYDVHTGVNSSLVERAPEVVDFLGNMFIGALALGDLATWKTENDKEWDEAAIYWLKNNEDTWTQWVPSDVADKVKRALEKED